MGPERLNLRRRLQALALTIVAAALLACGGAPVRRPSAEKAEQHGRHVQVFHAMKTPERHALVARLHERNVTPPPSHWAVNEDALVASLTVVDPFAGFLRRARREAFDRPARAVGPIDEAKAVASAREFVKRNADLLGLPRHVVPGLAERVRAVEAGPHVAWAVRLEAPFASKGYEGFKELENLADVEVYVDDDGEISSFVNYSRIHPRLTIDTRPGLLQEDPRVLAKLVGRRVFALESSTGGTSLGAASLDDVRALRRIQLGEVSPADVTHMQLVIHVSTGPQLAWLTYRLGYYVEVAKPAPGEPGTPPRFFFFRYVVDADTGDVLEDASAPVAAAAPFQSP